MMKSPAPKRYTTVAIGLHWLMAFLILAMLAVGKYMVSLDETSHLRFTLTQWHKTIGVLLLLLAVARLLWRLTHRAPAHPKAAPLWEKLAAHGSHILLYVLLFVAPVTGWMLVSVSPLNIDTLLFNVIPWPHLPWLHDLVDKESAVARYHDFHAWATGLLILLLFVHIAAGLKHHFVNKDTVLTRISPVPGSGSTSAILASTIIGCAIVASAVYTYNKLNSLSVPMSAGSSEVSLVATIMGESTPISFTESTVTSSLDENNPSGSTLQASVNTASVISDNMQVVGSLPLPDWFDTQQYPTATFVASRIELVAPGQFDITGELTIKAISLEQNFTMQIDETDGGTEASGEFTVKRLDYNLGMESQPDTISVADEVLVRFKFDLSSTQ